MLHKCQACGDPCHGMYHRLDGFHTWINQKPHCDDCYHELMFGIIPAEAVVLLDEDDDEYDGLADDGELDNAVRAYEDDMPDATEWGHRDAGLSHGYQPWGYQ